MNSTTKSFFNSLKEHSANDKPKSIEVWAYTRVSSKDQESNYSLQNQKHYIQEYCDKNGYKMSHVFGSTYESAKDDFTREEFSKMIKEVKKVKNRPFAIAVFIMSRFSRNVKSIGIVEELVEDYGVNIIEVSTGQTTETEDGKLAIYDKLLVARRENVNRLRMTIPGMIRHLKAGNWLGNVPRGYNHSGPRAKKHSHTQMISLDNEGKILKESWMWKLLQERDFIIAKKLAALGIKITRKQLFNMWRNPFYCGINNNTLLEEPVEGKWEKMVSIEDFITIQNNIKNAHRGSYKHEKEHTQRPLHGTILCPLCETNLVGYSVKKPSKKGKGDRFIHYYKCNTHSGVSFNAETTVRARNIGVHQIFEKIVSVFQFDQEDLEILAKQLNKILDKRTEHNQPLAKDLNRRLDEVEKTTKEVRVRFATGAIDREDRDLALEQLNHERAEVLEQLAKQDQNLSNQKTTVDSALKYARNLCWGWVSAPLHAQQALQKLIFPNGLVIDRENGRYLTKTVNALFAVIATKSMIFDEKEKGLIFKIDDQSFVVAGA